MIQRDDDPEAERRARTAELLCDFATLCPMRFQQPNVVSRDRVLQANARCNTGNPLARYQDPCLLPNFGRLAPLPPSGSPLPTPQAGGSGSGAGAGSTGGLQLPSLDIRFNLGSAAFTISLPATLAIRLPISFRGAQRLAFALDASPSGFSFTATIDAIPHVRIIARAGVNSSGTGSTGLTVQTTRTVCRAVDEQAARSALTAAGNRLRDAILAIQNPPAPAPDASELSRTFAPHARWGELVAALVNVNTQIETVRAACREVPFISVDFGARTPLTTPSPTAPQAERETFFGITGTLRF